jgi:hypothetical protein
LDGGDGVEFYGVSAGADCCFCGGLTVGIISFGLCVRLMLLFL